jgi:hypothetical protein
MRVASGSEEIKIFYRFFSFPMRINKKGHIFSLFFSFSCHWNEYTPSDVAFIVLLQDPFLL